MLSQLIPPRTSNSNHDTSQSDVDYLNNFSRVYSDTYIRLLLQLLYKHFPNHSHGLIGQIPILDLGCGWAPFAHALATIETTLSGLTTSQLFEYHGVDIRQENISFLAQAYKSYPGYKFTCHIAPNSVDYIGSYVFRGPNVASTVSESNGHECSYASLESNYYALQWSNSLVTHLTPSAVDNLFSSIASTLQVGGLSINCLLLADACALQCMKLGLADRQLFINQGSYYTYSSENPLLCTAYTPEYLFKIYQKYGLRILDVQNGHWRGDGSTNSFGNYIDVIVAQKM